MARRGFPQRVLTMAPPGVPKDVQIAENVTVHARRLPVLPIPSKLEGYFGLVGAWAKASLLHVLRNRAQLKKEIGLVHAVVPAAGLDAAVDAQLDLFRKASPTAVAATKKLLAAVHGRAPGDVLALTVENIAAQRISPEGQEGLRAFLEKRPAAWAAPKPGR